MNVIVREAVPDDAEALVAYLQRLAGEEDIDIPLMAGEFGYTVAQEREFLADFAASDNSVFLVAEHEGKLVGQLTLEGGRRQRLRHAAELGISVAREWRGQGVGRALLARAVQWAGQSGVLRRVELHVYARNARAIHLYESFGFQAEGVLRRAVYQDGAYLDVWMMALLL